jgi:hypothetical protein
MGKDKLAGRSMGSAYSCVLQHNVLIFEKDVVGAVKQSETKLAFI